MHRSRPARVIPASLTAVSVAIPSATAALVMLHAMIPGAGAESGVPVPSSGTSAVAAIATATPKPFPRATSLPTAGPRPTRATIRTIAGPAIDDPYGAVQATVAVRGKKITNVSISAPEDDPHSASINQYAVPLLRSETLRAQSASVNLISGATATSEAYLQSLQATLQTAGL